MEFEPAGLNLATLLQHFRHRVSKSVDNFFT